MRHLVKLSVGLACLCLATSSEALAKSRRHAPHYASVTHHSHRGRPPLVVERRSFLDPGTKVPVGSTNRYMLQQTFYNQDPIEANQRSWYMRETLPRRFDQPWSEGQFQF